METLRETLTKFLAQSKTDDLRTNEYLKSYGGCKVVVSFGKGNVARVPWIAFLHQNQKTRDGIYPAFLLYKRFDLLVLAYGVSETLPPTKNWRLPENIKSVGDFLAERGLKEEKYNGSHVFRTYPLGNETSWSQVQADLDDLIQQCITSLQG